MQFWLSSVRASLAQAALTQQGLINIEATKPAGQNGYVGGGMAFIPGGTDSIAQNTLVINWAVPDTIDPTKNNQIFQRITIPAGGGTPTVLATATHPLGHALRWRQSVRQGLRRRPGLRRRQQQDSSTGIGTGTYATRFVNFDLFNSNTTVSSVGYSAANGDNTQRTRPGPGDDPGRAST